ncbi:hypothetical protein [Xylophilus rhododendri]|nr:hypothetical protein [Xylophilus rhododendri]
MSDKVAESAPNGSLQQARNRLRGRMPELVRMLSFRFHFDAKYF